MSGILLILYSREGCCLCEGLRQRLMDLSLEALNPPIKLTVIDIDAPETSKVDKDRYDLQVPVMVLYLDKINQKFELPRVSPRLTQESLFLWLQKAISKILELT